MANSYDDFQFVISRTFDAPRDIVWKAWSDPEQSKKWFGPKGSKVTYTSFDFRSGGAVRSCMEFNGTTMYGQWAYLEVKAPEKLVAIVSFLDEKGNPSTHPMHPGWPREVLSTVTFTAKGDKTEITVVWQAHNATDAEKKVFEDGKTSMQGGWGGSFEMLEEFLRVSQAA